MHFINVKGYLVNLENVITIGLSNHVLRISYVSDNVGELFYDTEDQAKIAFSEIKLEIDKVQSK